MAVIKANAYGHGIVKIAKTLAGADCLGVARLTEAKTLRDAGNDTPIALLGGVFSSDDLRVASDLSLQVCIHSEVHIGWLEKTPRANLDVWLKVDTGMNRLGIRPDQVAAAIDRLRQASAVGELRLMTHLANADDLNDSTTKRQLNLFAEAVGDFSGDISVANSAGILGWPVIADTLRKALHDGRLWHRPGIALYGISPFPQVGGSVYGLVPALRFESRLIAIKKVAAGEKIGYGGTCEVANDTVVGLIAAGYGDGYSRHIGSGAPVLVNGRRVPVVGRVSMDFCTVDLGADADDHVGDEVELWGGELSVEEIAGFANTIPYTLVTGITDRVERVYEN